MWIIADLFSPRIFLPVVNARVKYRLAIKERSASLTTNRITNNSTRKPTETKTSRPCQTLIHSSVRFYV